MRLRKNATTRLKEREDGESAISYHGYIWTIDSNVGSGSEADALEKYGSTAEGCWILHEFNGAKWQYFENTSAAAEEVKKVSGYQGQAVRLRLNVSTRWSHFVHFSAGNVEVEKKNIRWLFIGTRMLSSPCAGAWVA